MPLLMFHYLVVMPGNLRCCVRSTVDMWVGTWKAILMSFPVRSGMAMPTALVPVGARLFQAALCFPERPSAVLWVVVM